MYYWAKTSSAARVVKDLTKQGAMDYTIVASSTVGQPAPLQYLHPIQQLL